MAINNNPAESALIGLNDREFGRIVSSNDLSSLLTQASQGPDLGAGLQDATDAAAQSEESFTRGLGRYGTTLTRDQFMARNKQQALDLATTHADIATNTRGRAKDFRVGALSELANVRQTMVEQARVNLGGAARNANARDEALKADKAAKTASDKQTALATAAIVATLISSREYKDDIKAYDPSKALDTVEGLDLVQFTYKEGIDALPGTHIGLIAEDVPDIIATEDHKALNAYNMIGILLGAVQELSTQVRDLKGAK
jgi:hypothetical protein